MPPLAVLATRMGHFAGSSPILPIVTIVLCESDGDLGYEEAMREERKQEFLKDTGRRGAIVEGIAELQWRISSLVICIMDPWVEGRYATRWGWS